jgi:hypothetical protein
MSHSVSVLLQTGNTHSLFGCRDITNRVYTVGFVKRKDAENMIKRYGLQPEGKIEFDINHCRISTVTDLRFQMLTINHCVNLKIKRGSHVRNTIIDIVDMEYDDFLKSSFAQNMGVLFVMKSINDDGSLFDALSVTIACDVDFRSTIRNNPSIHCGLNK